MEYNAINELHKINKAAKKKTEKEEKNTRARKNMKKIGWVVGFDEIFTPSFFLNYWLLRIYVLLSMPFYGPQQVDALYLGLCLSEDQCYYVIIVFSTVFNAAVVLLMVVALL